MVRKLYLPLALLTCLALSGADAQTHRGRPVVVAPIQPVSPIATPPSPGLNASGTNAAGVPNTSRPGTIGTGASPSGLAGDSSSAPGFPGPVGQWQK